MKRSTRLAAAFFGILLMASHAGAAIIYLQNFSETSGMTALTNLNWEPYYGNSTNTVATLAMPGNNTAVANAMISGGPSAPTPGANVNATQAISSTVDGFVPLLSAYGNDQFFVYTNEYTINTSVNTPTSFSWYAASASAGDSQRLVVQIDGNWYASTSSITPFSPVGNGNSFGGDAVKYTTPFTTSASAWETVNFSAGSLLTLGSVLTSPLPGDNITGFGIYADIADNSTGVERTYFDSFEVDATPEPGAGLMILGSVATLLLRRRRAVR